MFIYMCTNCSFIQMFEAEILFSIKKPIAAEQ